MATKKVLGNRLKLGDKFVLPRETVKIIGKGDIPYAVVSEEKGSILCYQVELTSGPLKGQQTTIIVLGEGKVDMVLRDPPVTRALAWCINTCKRAYQVANTPMRQPKTLAAYRTGPAT